MEIPIRFRLLLFWKSMFIRQSKAPKIKISKGQQQLLSKVPEIENQIKVIDDELRTIKLSFQY